MATKYSEFFLHAVEETLVAEGVLSDETWDPGGVTKYGIIKDTLDEYVAKTGKLAGKAIFYLTKEDAVDIYWELFWLKGKINLIPDKYVAAECFDSGVNCGVFTGVKFMQRALNFLRPKGWAEIDDDGDIGPKETLPLLNWMLKNGFRINLIVAMNGELYRHYVETGKRNEALRAGASRGWMRRVLVAHQEELEAR